MRDEYNTEQTMDSGSQMVGKIYWDPANGQFYIDNKRPAFKKCVTRYMNNGQNRCHTISFHLLSVLLCDFANNLNQNKFISAVNHMKTTFGVGIQGFYNGGGIPRRSVTTYSNQLVNIVAKLVNKIRTSQGGAQIENPLSQFLSHLNSCPYNLRYPVNANVNWNQAVGEAFDPRMWCYVDGNGDVVSDDRSLPRLFRTNLQAYCAGRGMANMPADVGAGFYLLDRGDCYLMRRMFGLAARGFLSQMFINNPQLFLSTSVSATGVEYLPSSSNNYPVQLNNPFQASIYYYDMFTNQWQLF